MINVSRTEIYFCPYFSIYPRLIKQILIFYRMKYKLHLICLALLAFSFITLSDARVRRKKVKKTKPTPEPVETSKKTINLQNNSDEPVKISLNPEENHETELPKPKRNGKRKAVKRKVDGVQNQQPNEDYVTDYTDYDNNYGDYNEGSSNFLVFLWNCY